MFDKDFYLRFCDIVASFVLILFFSPILLLLSILIKLQDFKSPVFAEKHMRVGKGGSLFFMYKFRTMVPNSHELLLKDPRFKKLKDKQEKGVKIKMSEDPRLTRLGKIIRKFDLDELPQLFNVLKGDMSLVGPRAYFKEELDIYTKRYKIFKDRIDHVLTLRPGMTGLWQVSGRNLLSVKKRVEYDYIYLKKRSLFFNILILLKTPYVVLTRYGAYD